jgi:putative hydrolase of the HAD superfamily
VTRSPTRLLNASDWVFDLDNTLYPADADLFAQIDVRMTQFVGEYLGIGHDEAKAMQKSYYAEHGTTLTGMMRLHDMPASQFLDYVHDLDYSVVKPHPELRAAIEALPGRKLVFTNGSRGHAERTLKALGLEGLFHDLFDIEATNYQPKPKREAFDAIIDAHVIEPTTSVMVEDLARNLQTAHYLGMATILVTSTKDWSHEPEIGRPAGSGDHPAFVDFVTDNLTGFLKAVTAPILETRT